MSKFASMLSKQICLALLTLVAAVLIIVAGYRGISVLSASLDDFAHWTTIDATMRQGVVNHLLQATTRIGAYMKTPTRENYEAYDQAMKDTRGGLDDWVDKTRGEDKLLAASGPISARINAIAVAMSKYRTVQQTKSKALKDADTVAALLNSELRQAVTMVIVPERQAAESRGNAKAVSEWNAMHVVLGEKVMLPLQKLIMAMHEFGLTSDKFLLRETGMQLSQIESGLYEWEELAKRNQELADTAGYAYGSLAQIKVLAKVLRNCADKEAETREILQHNTVAVTTVVDQLIKENIVPAKQAAVDNAARARTESLTAMTVTAVVAAGLTLIVSLIFALRLSRALRRVSRFADSVAKGDLEATLETRRKDEIGQICRSLSAIPVTLRDVLGDFEDIASRVESGDLQARADHGKYEGAYADLMTNANRLADSMVSIFDSLPLPVITIDREMSLLYMNQAARDVADANEDFQGTACFEHFSASGCNSDECPCRIAMETGEPTRASSLTIAGGRDFEMDFLALPVRDERGNIAGAIKIFMDQTGIKRAQQRMHTSAQQAEQIVASLSAAADELAAQMEQVKTGSGQQKGMSAEAATAMSQMNATVLEIARNASDAAENTSDAREHASVGGSVVQQVVDSIQTVHTRAEEMNQSMQELEGTVKGIGEVMRVISDIADQTNLLALNAAIEAARAGDAGRGFAVVADEVRKLAEKTMNATDEVDKAIRSIQAGAAKNSEAMRNASRAVNDTTHLADKAGEALASIVLIVESTDDQVHSIATAAEEQSATSEQVSSTVESVDELATEMDEAMSQSASAVAELARLAMEVKSLVDDLKA
ncbi:methyl-accepting chemotaxis protein [Pseudodesulfovibrio tunisiensis]|uniref:methyl-accepting chemotaxis protein n=1 Tax=Pseudodesulfovibrio tunisiensis TaxID=463192 RepID=UPI001FB5458C|nr:methyl-accepting chemotaxis protein [Pseudodesulfovibrio tunisiensis]